MYNSPYRGKEGTFLFVETHGTNQPIEDHIHDFQEFVLVSQGSCVHRFKKSEITLIPGDVLIIPPGEEHAYTTNAGVTVFNCQFFVEKMGHYWQELMDIVSFDTAEAFKDAGGKGSAPARARAGTPVRKVHNADINHQGIIHLDSENFSHVAGLLKSIIQEQEACSIGYEYLNQAYLTNILIVLKRVQTRQYASLDKHSSKRQAMINTVLARIEEQMHEPIDFNEISRELYVSAGHFRTIFKDVTGLSPVDYLNRARIVKSLEYLEAEDMNISDAAAKVGIYDANYYSRLFKKIMGYSPRYFKRICELC